MSKPAKLVKSKVLSHLSGVADVSMGCSPAERRMAGDHSKDGIAPDTTEYDDVNDCRDRWAKLLTSP